MGEEEEIRKELELKLKEREDIVAGKARATPEEIKKYNNLGKVILTLRRKLYKR